MWTIVCPLQCKYFFGLCFWWPLWYLETFLVCFLFTRRISCGALDYAIYNNQTPCVCVCVCVCVWNTIELQLSLFVHNNLINIWNTRFVWKFLSLIYKIKHRINGNNMNFCILHARTCNSCLGTFGSENRQKGIHLYYYGTHFFTYKTQC